jgi:hypothetical protein
MYPDLSALILNKFDRSQITCPQIREKLLNLYDYGDPTAKFAPDCSKMHLKTSLESLVGKYLREDISASKGADSWRSRYNELDDYPIEMWPDEAIRYSKMDCLYPLQVFDAQEERSMALQEIYCKDPLKTQYIRSQFDFSLYQISKTGIRTDKNKFKTVKKHYKDIAEAQGLILKEAGILRPAEEPKPKKNGEFTKGKKESINKSELQLHVAALEKAGLVVASVTPKWSKLPEEEKYKGYSVADEWLKENSHKSPVLEAYHLRQGTQKILNTELPRLMWEGDIAPKVYTKFDALKETGRTSSYAAESYPSINCQNVDGRVRDLLKARKGYKHYSIDYNQIELCTLAQTLVSMYGEASMADMINGGIDLHSLTGSRLYNEELGEDVSYEYFKEHKNEDRFRIYRLYGKVVNLGLPGGLGTSALVGYAKSTYDIVLTDDQAETFKAVWLDIFPEMRSYFRDIRSYVDDRNTRIVPDKMNWKGDPWIDQRYWYCSDLGMVRSNCRFTQIANGLGLQTPAAEGEMLAVISIIANQLSKDSIISEPYQYVTAFIHDEVVGEVIEDGREEERVKVVSDIMIECMKIICPDVDIKTESHIGTNWKNKK